MRAGRRRAPLGRPERANSRLQRIAAHRLQGISRGAVEPGECLDCAARECVGPVAQFLQRVAGPFIVTCLIRSVPLQESRDLRRVWPSRIAGVLFAGLPLIGDEGKQDHSRDSGFVLRPKPVPRATAAKDRAKSRAAVSAFRFSDFALAAARHVNAHRRAGNPQRAARLRQASPNTREARFS